MVIHREGNEKPGPAARPVGSSSEPIRLTKVKFTHKMRRPGHVEAMTDHVTAAAGDELELEVYPHVRIKWLSKPAPGREQGVRYVPIEQVEFYEC